MRLGCSGTYHDPDVGHRSRDPIHSYLKKMAALSDAVPNIDPEHKALSRSGRRTGARWLRTLLPQSDGRLVRRSAPNRDEAQPAEKPFPFLRLPSEIRNKIYDELLSAKKNVFKLPHPCWRCGPLTLEQDERSLWLRDEFDYAPINTMKAAYCFNVSILAVNKQINREASPFLGCRNNWVQLTISDRELIDLLHRMGCARPLQVSGALTSGSRMCR
jgi:hypothetical protein